MTTRLPVNDGISVAFHFSLIRIRRSTPCVKMRIFRLACSLQAAASPLYLSGEVASICGCFYLRHEPATLNSVLITPLQLVDEPLEFDETIAPGVLDYTADIRQVSPMPVKGVADLLVEHRSAHSHVNDIRLRARFSSNFEILCARCADPVAVPLEGDFDLIFRPETADADAGERAITPDETEIGYYQESGLLLEDVVREQVLLSLPSRTLCTAD